MAVAGEAKLRKETQPPWPQASTNLACSTTVALQRAWTLSTMSSLRTRPLSLSNLPLANVNIQVDPAQMLLAARIPRARNQQDTVGRDNRSYHFGGGRCHLLRNGTSGSDVDLDFDTDDIFDAHELDLKFCQHKFHQFYNVVDSCRIADVRLRDCRNPDVSRPERCILRIRLEHPAECLREPGLVQR